MMHLKVVVQDSAQILHLLVGINEGVRSNVLRILKAKHLCCGSLTQHECVCELQIANVCLCVCVGRGKQYSQQCACVKASNCHLRFLSVTTVSTQIFRAMPQSSLWGD